MDVITIGIAGGTGSGKTTITKRIVGEFGEDVTVINYDNYYKAHNDMTYEEQHYYKGVFFLGNSESMIMEELQCAEKRLRHVKKSCILKFALALDLAIVK